MFSPDLRVIVVETWVAASQLWRRSLEAARDDQSSTGDEARGSKNEQRVRSYYFNYSRLTTFTPLLQQSISSFSTFSTLFSRVCVCVFVCVCVCVFGFV